jgi:hypothetical protein
VHRRSSLLALLLSVWLAVSVAAPAQAVDSAWDPNDTNNVLDLKWVGIYRQDADTTRVSITFWNPVRDWMLRWNGSSGGSFGLSLESLGLLYNEGWGLMYVNYGPDDHGRLGWRATLYDGGSSGVLGQYPAAHPNPYTFLVWLSAPHVTDVVVETRTRGSVTLDRIPSAGWLIPTMPGTVSP